MTDRSPPHLTVIDGTVEEPPEAVPESSPAPPITPPITPPRGYEKWKRKSFSEGLIEAYHRLGGIDYLVQFGRDNPADFVRACSRLIPREIRADISGQVTIVHAIPPTALDVHVQDTENAKRRIRFIDREALLAESDAGEEDGEEE
jgi:hypothetical protein